MNLLDEIVERGYHLNYLRGHDSDWEASISRKLPEQTPNGYIYAVGYAVSSWPNQALADALDNCENDYERLEILPVTLDYAPRIAEQAASPGFNLAALLANLRQPTPAVFRRKL